MRIVQHQKNLSAMAKSNRETRRAKAISVEEDHALGPIVQEEIFYRKFDEGLPKDCCSDQVHILVSVYKYRVWVEQYDTCDQVWYLVGDSFHYKGVEIGQSFINREFNTHNPRTILRIIKERCGGPHAIERFIHLCRSSSEYFCIHEQGPQRDNLIRHFYKAPLGDVCHNLIAANK